jgi:hypothetical protein
VIFAGELLIKKDITTLLDRRNLIYNFLLRRAILYKLTIDEKTVIPHGNGVSGETDNPLDETFAIPRRKKDDNIPALRLRPFYNLQSRVRDLEIIGQFVDENTVPYQNCG